MAVRNPFTPGFGVSPVILAGRTTVIRQFERALAGDLPPGQRHVLVSGARGTGKTVLLTEFEAAAIDSGWATITLHTASTSLMDELRAAIVEHLRRIDPEATRSRITEVGVSGVSAGRDVLDRYAAERTSTGRLLDRLTELVSAQDTGVLITLDEVQSADTAQLHEVTQHIQDQARHGRSISFVAAGVRTGVDALLEHEKTTFLRRAESVELGSVAVGTAAEAISQTVADTAKGITPEAAVLAGEISQGYPYLIQLVGAFAWDSVGEAETIEVQDVQQNRTRVIEQMVKNVHRPALRGLSRAKKDYLYAMLQDEGPSRVADIADRLGKSHGYQSVYRDRLITDELIRPADRGSVQFALPYLREALEALRNGQTPLAGTDELTRSRRGPRPGR